jgi:replication factor C small subunit
VVEFNASDERGITVIREKIKKLAFTRGERVILLDEADNMTSDAQHALRRIMEKAAPGIIFVLTANEEWRIIDPIKSRCTIFRFRKLNERELLKIITMVLRTEGYVKNITPEMKKAILYLVRYVDGDARKALNYISDLILKGQEVTEANIKMLIPPDMIEKALNLALNGNFENALKLVEDAFLENKLEPYTTVKQLYKALSLLNNVPKHIKIRLYMKLGETERNIRMGCSPIIQFASFLATAWVARYVPSGVKE